MYCCLPLAATLIWQLLSFVHAASNTEVLVPFSEDNWDTTSQGKVRRRSSNSSGVILQESEQFIWGPDAGKLIADYLQSRRNADHNPEYRKYTKSLCQHDVKHGR